MPEPAVGGDEDADDGWARARWRLRDLRGRDLLLAIGLLAVVLVPFAVALVRAARDGWVPSGDEANIATRAYDVFSRHPPLTGLPSTSRLYGDQISTNHPGPIEFYLIAVPLRLFGMSAGPLLTAAAVNAGFGLIALWAFFRRLGLTVMLWAGVLLLAVFWSGGTSVLTDTLSSNMTMYALLCTAVLAWAVIDGDLRLLPIAALVASYAAQQHLAAGLVVVVLTAAVVVVLAVRIVQRVRRGEPTITKSALLWSSAAAVVAVACWVPVFYDELRHHPGNLTEIVKFARDNTRPTLGFRAGVYQVLHAINPPTILGRTDTPGLFFLPRLGTTWFGLGALVVAALIGVVAWGVRVRSGALARLALVALILLGAGVINGANVPASLESWRINLYRWAWAGAFLTWTTIGLGLAVLAGRVVNRTSLSDQAIMRRARRLGPLTLLVIAALIATAITLVGGSDDHNREAPAYALEKRVGATVLAHVDRHRPVVVLTYGYAGGLTVGPYVIFRLVQAGFDVEAPPALASTYGLQRAYNPATNPQAIVVASGETTVSPEPGTLLTTQLFSPERTALLDNLAAAARGVKVVLAPGARATIDAKYKGLLRVYVDELLDQLPTDPRTVLQQPVFLDFFVKGMIRSPALDIAKVRRLLALPAATHTIGGDERVQIRLLSPAQLRGALLRGL